MACPARKVLERTRSPGGRLRPDLHPSAAPGGPACGSLRRVTCPIHPARRRRTALRSLAWLVILVGVEASATDLPIAGRKLSFKTKTDAPDSRKLSLNSERSPAIVAPLPDPTSGATLGLFTSNAAGHCRAELALPADRWTATRSGWVYRDRKGEASPVRKVILRTGRKGGKLSIRAKGALPCGLEAEAQAEPFHVTLNAGSTRYCAEFGGEVKRNEVGRFEARRAEAPERCPADDLTAATLNVLHGLSCPPPTEACRLADRVSLLGDWITLRGCPAIVALQEVADTGIGSVIEEVERELLNVCPEPYHLTWIPDNVLDASLILSRHRPLESEFIVLLNGFRNVLFVRLDHPLGVFDVYSTHLASSSDSGGSECGFGQPCPPECVAAGATTVRDCQAEQTALALEARRQNDEPAIVMGDMNAEPGSFVYEAFTGRGWLDASFEAGVTECDPTSGLGCTSGREGETLDDLESPALGVDRRIDFAFVVPPRSGARCSGGLDTADDLDGDGIATRLFADEPNPLAPECGQAPAPICWVSDHTGVQVDWNCGALALP